MENVKSIADQIDILNEKLKWAVIDKDALQFQRLQRLIRTLENLNV